ncbi:5' nucleotidase, NT5C type [Flagellimonas lutaonensis]|uniref:5''''-3''''-deoxyribonucleotidase n=1 Tax=Flagellimonas lutaonensis TaxID=516051 RepID=A0A0D5YS70_9FLAO|nr:5'-3'-deoxyribonucleotidase [Allomuricauda lutaonensis]AKA34764.1 5''''-3''''-deoxyribonucleotidase [Allomuricauda lutaonensis]
MTLFVDMDEVLAETYLRHIELYNQDFGENLTVEECKGKEVWQVVPKERQKSIQNHANTIGFFRDLKPVKDSQEVMRELCDRYEVYIASAAMQFPYSLKEKSDWLDEHFPFIHWRKRILCGDKYILRGDVLIDDRSYNLEPFDGSTILFTSPHNIFQNGFERANNWQEIAEKLL